MIGDILGKALVVVKADTSQAKAAIKDLSETEQKAARERVAAQEKANEAADRGIKNFALFAAAGAAAFTLLSSGIKKYEEHLKSLGQGGEAELRKLNNAQKKLTEAQDGLLIALGKLALAAAPAAEKLAEMAQSLANIVGGVGNLIERAKGMGGGRVGSVLNWAWDNSEYINPATRMTALGLDALDYLSGGPRQDVTSGSLNMSEDLTGVSEFGMERPPDFMIKNGSIYWDRDLRQWVPRKKPPKPKSSGGGFTLDAATPAEGATVQYYDWLANGIRTGIDEYLPRALGALEEGVEGFGSSDTISSANAMRKAMERQGREGFAQAEAFRDRESMLEGIFGPVTEFEAYTTAWQGLEAVVSAGLGAWIDGSKSAGEAMKAALHGFAKQLAGEAALQALRHTAYGFGQLAFPDPLSKLSAAQHFAAAGKWAAVGVAAGIVGGATRPAVGGANANAAAGLGGARSSGGGTGGVALTIVQGDSFANDSPRYVARRTSRAIALARRYDSHAAAVPG